MVHPQPYSRSFFQDQAGRSRASARRILPLVDDAVHPRSVIDVGCGVGSWLSVWRDELHVDRVVGVEGPWVPRALLQVPADCVRLQDLRDPIDIAGRFDLAMSLEVAEHLPPTLADEFVARLVALSDVVLFSAAVPGQGGTSHLNERPPEYWAERFASHGYVPADLVRAAVWNDGQVDWWYRQNALIYVRRTRLPDFPALRRASEATDPAQLFRVHPALYLKKSDEVNKVRSTLGYVAWRTYPLRMALLEALRKAWRRRP